MEAKNLEGIQYQQYENLQNKQSIKKFLSEEYPYKKLFLCDQWFNGNCIIPQEKCQHAHGIKDLVYNKVDYDPINDFDFKHQYIGKYRQQKQFYNKDIQVSVNILDESKFYYLKFPKLGQEFGRKNYVQLIEYAKKNKKLYSDQWKRINDDREIRLKIKKKYHQDFILEIVNFLFQKYKQNLTLDVFNLELQKIWVPQNFWNHFSQTIANNIKNKQKQIVDNENNINDQDNSNNDEIKNGDRQKQKQSSNQITYWQTLIEKSNKLRKKYFLLKKRLKKEDFSENYPFDENQQCYRFYIKELPKQKEVEHLIIEKAVQICKKIKNESGFPIKWSEINQLDFFDENIEGFNNLKFFFETFNIRYTTFFEEKVFGNQQNCQNLGIEWSEMKICLEKSKKQQKKQMKKNNQDGEEQDIEKNNIYNNFDDEDKDEDDENDNDEDINHMSQYFVYDSQKKKKGRLTQEEIQQEIQRYLNSKIPYEKETLCRFYLRGCCRFTKEECKYAHDLDDLKNFKKLSQMEREIDFKYKIKDYDQRPLLDPLRVQYSLVDYQKKLLKLGQLDREYSIEELTQNKKERVKVRDLMHKNMYIEFYFKLLEIYKDDNFFFTDSFLIGEYNRVGFNKIGNQVSYKYITQFLCNQVAYDVQIMLPPLIQPKFKTNCIRQLPKSEEMFENFQSKVFEAIINQGELKGYPVQEADIKKVFYKDNISLDMPLHTFLTLKKLSFTKFISEILEQDKFTKIIEEQENYKKAQSQNQNLSVKNAVIFDFDKEKCVQILSSILAELQKSNKILVDLKILENKIINEIQTQVILVDDLKSLEYAYFILVQNIEQFLLKKEMGVDLEGSLRLGGRIDLVQISVQFKEEARIQIFVFDALTLGQEKLLYDKFRFILQETIGNEKILKIFHDCRKDSLALHFNTGICVKNVFDTAAVHMFREEIEGYFTAHLQKDTFSLMRYLEFTIKWPGLNDILETYQASHGINQQKDDMHRKFSDQRYAEYFRSRPIKDDYLEYSARDVEDLIEVKQNMMNCIKELGVKEKMQMDSQILEYVVLQMSQDYAKDCLLEFKQKIIEKFCNNQEFVFDTTLQYILMEQQNSNKL